ncbi:MAG: hypothetical protein ACE5F1_05840 [Planctomycetota bacterium]
MRKDLKRILHNYKVEAFKRTHSHEALAEVTKECLTFRDEALKNAYHYHFHKLPDANRVEIINMINNYTLEAILPPVVEKIMRRVVVLERQHDALLEMLTEVLEVLPENEKGTEG